MHTAFEKTYADHIIGKLTAIDRLVIHGHFTYFFQPGCCEHFLWRQKVLLKDFKPYVLKATAKLRAHALQLAAEARRPYIHLDHVLKGKDDLAKRIAERDGITEGLICVLSTLEVSLSFDIQGNHRTHKLEVVRRPRKCLHVYFYFIDPEFGLIHLRLQSWFPFQIQVYIDGREWLARQLERRGIGFRRYENALLDVTDLDLAQEISDRLGRRKWPRRLDAFARRVNPWLPIVQRFGAGLGYYWVVDQCEIATDIMWKERASLAALMPDLFDHAIRAFSAHDVMRFLGRKLTVRYRGEIVSDDERLYAKSAKYAEEARRRCARVSRLIAKLRRHGLIAKVQKRRLYRVTIRGQRLMSAAIRYRDRGLPASMDAAA